MSSDLKQFRKAAKAAGIDPEPAPGPGDNSSKAGFWGGIALAIVMLIAVAFALSYSSRGGGGTARVEIAIGSAIGLFGLCVALSRLPQFVRRWPGLFRAESFADDNDLVFAIQRDAPEYRGFLFTIPAIESARLYNFTTTSTPTFETGQFRLSTDATNGRKITRAWGYIAVEIANPAPARAVLRSRNRASERVLPLGLAQSIGSASEIDSLFTLYGPDETRPTAIALLTPELIGRLHELEAKYGPINVELVDNHVFVYSPKKFDMYDPATIRMVFDTIASITT